MKRLLRIKENFQAYLRRQLWILRLRRRGSFSQSHLVSLFVRPFFEKERSTLFVGAPLLAGFLAIGGFSSPSSIETALTPPALMANQQDILSVDVVLPESSNEIGYLLPVERMKGISQGFHPGHPGIDITAEMYSPVTVIDGGTVSKVSYGNVGYGNHIYVEHDNDMTTLYAHLHRIYVEEGQELTAGTIIGTVGMSGRTTGPHVHFEVYVNSASHDPMGLIARAVEREQSK